MTQTMTENGLILGEDGRARPAWASTSPLLREYYDTEWGMPVRDETGLYERLTLEAFQSGLSWETVLRKREAFRRAFHDFDPDRVARFAETDVARLLDDATIIRNRRKIAAAITNARATVELRGKGGLADFIWAFQPETTPAPETWADIRSTSPESVALAKALKKEGFVFVGPTTMYALMQAIGMVDDHLVGSWRRGSSGVWA
ncbi:DNA-3-methyladenine glycosylase I [Corynebacterium guangdongense]|uniref:DNA-3-methyladenine glycosylase I n=1 Tax=Corynebacterium guangdongense TaxID=1783348 RepID=A0ABU1ZVA4_9CORY|nr:DNA-3-methyladenine glycosylase I [Corynebacterium guangdongense]MDR7328846.1 DNA-3-methyladenine glycosylase I [Corynebacterium guangdongense]WJZ17421.1 DNA-3-methyladenine glycosylase 1 [Corynebacterium guangdongense]